jgi:class 3 adenylate cyclase
LIALSRSGSAASVGSASINTVLVIAGTIGGAGQLVIPLIGIPLIGDTVNVAARAEQLTKTTGDAILLTHHTVDPLVTRPPGLTDRGSHALKGKSAAMQVFSLDPGRAERIDETKSRE